jgi:hypothetical protein
MLWPSLGNECIFNTEKESETEKHVLLLAKPFFLITSTDLRRIAYEFAKSNEIKIFFAKTVD